MTDYQCIMLAGIPNAPSVYSLDVNPELARQRMAQGIKQMIKCGYIDENAENEIALTA